LVVFFEFKETGMKKIVQEQGRGPQDNFWLFGGLLCILLVSILARDIGRPFTGLHSWGEASGAWAARAHVKYGLAYTKGVSTWAVGNPPTKNPTRYFDHPQLSVLTLAIFMSVLGVSEWSYRLVNCIASVLILLVVLRILKGLLDDKTALLAGLIYVLFPINGYFGCGYWVTLMGLTAVWYYLVLIKGLKDGPEPGRMHKWALAAALFLALQFSWEGFFYALAIGVHYLCRCIRRRQVPEKTLLTILIIAPLSSLALDLLVMVAGYGWNFSKIIDLYKWRAAKGEMAEFDWGKWFARFWEFAAMNFTLPALIIAVAYLTFGQLFVLTGPAPQKDSQAVSRRFPQFWLLFLPGFFQLFLLRGALWMHHYWERPFSPLVAIAAALGIMTLADILDKARPVIAKICTTALVGVITIACVRGVSHYYSIRHFSPERVKLFRMLNERIPPDKMLLSYQSQKVEQHEAKGEHYRPEIAWYLDREIVVATTWAEIQQKAQTGMFSYYLVPAVGQVAPLIQQLQQRYKFESVPGDPGGPELAPMLPHLIFDLQSKAAGS
jgi:hypothetical protein